MSDPVSGAAESVWVVRGNPSDEELAAVVTVLSARASSAGPRSVGDPIPSGWSAYWRAVRAPLLPGPDAWRASGRPR